MKKASRLKRAFTARFAIILCAIIVIAIVVGGGILRINRGNKRVEDLEGKKAVMMQAEIAHYKWVLNLSDAVNYSVDFTGEKDPTKCVFGKFVYSDVKNDPDMKSFYDKVEPLHKQLHSLADQVLTLASTDRNGAVLLLKGDVNKTVGDLSTLLNQETTVMEKKIQAQYASMRRLVTVIAVLAIIDILVILLCVYDIFAYISKNVIKPIGNLQAECGKLSEGQLHLTFDTEAKNEIGELGGILNRSIGEILKYIDAIDYAMSEFSKGNFTLVSPVEFLGDFVRIKESIGSFQDRMNNALVQIATAADQVSMGAEHVSNGSQTLAQGASEQAASVENLSATAKMFSEQIASNAEYSQQMDTFGKQSGDLVQKSQAEMQQMVDSIREIARTSEGIRNIIKTIDDIAFQTNILALNAAVEAARAGTAGKGFAVVADEVRSLAQKSAEAAQNTNTLIESSLTQIKKGEGLANRSYESFGQVAESWDKIVGMIEKIAHTSQDQSSLIEKIADELDRVSSIIQSNSATSEESAAASEELDSQADMMKELVKQFRLKVKGSNKGHCQENL